MMLKRSTTQPKRSVKARLVRAGVASLAAAGAIATLATGCLDRPVVKAEPTTSNVFVDQIIQTAVDKIDLLFMVDNSASMADKQDILKSAVPLLVQRLVTPNCLDGQGNPIGNTHSDSDGKCANGTPEFNPVGDIHIGIVTSSLGSHGANICDSVDHPDDKSHLIPSVRTPTVASWNNSGFLAWDHAQRDTPVGDNDATKLNTEFSNMIGAVGETGCGFEASLEGWYRFLVDPEPPDNVTLQSPAGQTPYTLRSSKVTVGADGKAMLGADGKPVCTGCDTTLLAQRAAFLRPDSLVAIVMLSDENDCSIRDDGVGWFVGSTTTRMPRSTQICDTDPNNTCCRSCAQNESGPPAGCQPLSADPVCKNIPAQQKFATWDALHDQLNLRCYNQHQRFGFDLLYPTSRYVSALTDKTIALQSNPAVRVTNPLYDNTGSDKAPRESSLVFLAGIIGVPWQDIADAPSETGTGLTYLTAKELAAPDTSGKTRWDYLLGTPDASPKVIPPLDPFMVETWLDRTTLAASGLPQTNTLANPPVSLKDHAQTNPQANVINGHEQNVPNFDDLQYACTFPLANKRTCKVGDQACDCTPTKVPASGTTPASSNLSDVTAANSPLCQPVGGGAPTATQNYAKAYPGARELTVLRDFGDNAIVASICPKIATDTSNPDYGYNPAVGAIIERLKEALKGKCLPRPLAVDAMTHQAECKVIEAKKSDCNCALDGRGPADAQVLAAVRKQLQATGNCGTGTQASCDSWCECEILQESPANRQACQGNQGGIPAGYCYISGDAATALGPDGNPPTADQIAGINSALAKCPDNQQQLLRFVTGSNMVATPSQGAIAFIACLGANVP